MFAVVTKTVVVHHGIDWPMTIGITVALMAVLGFISWFMRRL